jgi:GNAT superfamily N-acetyltransferase
MESGVDAARMIMMSETKLEVRGTTYRLAQIRGPEMAPLVPLFRQTFRRRDFTLDWLQKKYACAYEGVGGFSCVAFTESGQAVGSFGILPWPIRFGDRTEVAAQLVDAATHRDHRRRGLFTQLGRMACELSEAAGISFLFAFPHPQGDSYPAFIRNLGYEHIDDLVEYRKTICSGWLERASLHSSRLRWLYEKQVQRRLNAYTSGDAVLENSLISEGFAATERSRAFHAYKSFTGSRVLDLDGGRVWLKVRRGLLVGDLEASSEAGMEKTVKALELLAARLRIHQIIFQSSKSTRFSRFFEDRFQTLPCLTVVYRNLHSQIPAEKLRFTFGDLDNF